MDYNYYVIHKKLFNLLLVVMGLNLTNVTYTNTANSSIAAQNSSQIHSGMTGGSNATTIQIPGNLTANQAGTALLSHLSIGDSFTGEITNITQNQITISLSDSVKITALLSNALSYNIGDMASFTIKGNNGSQILLQSNANPNMNSMMNDQTITSALRNAGLAVNETNVSLVHEMMKQNVPIDGDTLNAYARALERSDSATPQDAVLLGKMGIPVTEDNVIALHDFYLSEGGIAHRAEDISKDFQNITIDALGTGNQNAGTAIEQMLSAFSEPISVPETLSQVMDSSQRNDLASMILSLDPNAQPSVQEEKNGSGPILQLQSENPQLNALANKIQSGELTAKDALKALSEFLQNENLNPETTHAFIHSKEFASLSLSLVRQELFIEPQDVSKDNVKKLMEKILHDSDLLTQKMTQISKNSSGSANANMLKQDTDFMNQMNHFMNYVQIPLKMFGQNAHGDLYVYKNHKQHNSEDEELKAALHLDMDHLGAVDVMVKLLHKNVTTDFKVESDEILSFIEAHIDELNVRLNALGYHVESKVSSMNQSSNYSFKSDVLEKELPPMEIKRFSFDVRA